MSKYFKNAVAGLTSVFSLSGCAIFAPSDRGPIVVQHLADDLYYVEGYNDVGKHRNAQQVLERMTGGYPVNSLAPGIYKLFRRGDKDTCRFSVQYDGCVVVNEMVLHHDP